MIKLLLFFAIGALLLLPLLLGLFSAVIYGVWRAFTYETRFRRFFAKYKNEEIARMIASGKIWTGQTSDQLQDAKGSPSRVERVQSSEIWVYTSGSLGKAMRISLANNRVESWS